MPIENAPKDEQQAPKRAAKRDSLFLRAELSREDGKPVAAARIRNLSATGMMAECNHHLSEGERVGLTLRGAGEITGSVSWVEDGRVGIAFDRPIDPVAARRPVAAGRPEPVSTPFASIRFVRPSR